MKKKPIFLLSIIAMATYGVQSLAWPLHLGRDGLNYIIYYVDILSRQPVYHLLMARRTPVAPILYGLPLSLFGSIVTEIYSALIYVLSIILIYRLAGHFGAKIGLVVALLVNFYPAYGAIFHVVASEPPATFFLLLTCLLFMDAMQVPRAKKFVLLGLCIVLASLSRPDSVALIGLAIGCLLFLQESISVKIRFALLQTGVVLALLLLWSGYNLVRYDDFAVARGEKAQIPLERAFVHAHIVRAENGPASAELIRLVETQLLEKEPYRSYHIDTEIFLTQGTQRMLSDLVSLSDQIYGWDSDYARLRDVGMEAVLAQPIPYFWGYIKASAGMLLFNPDWPAAQRQVLNPQPSQQNQDNLPLPTEGDLIPRAYYYYNSSSPDGRAVPDPNSLELRLQDPEMQTRQDELFRRLIPYQAMLPNRNGSHQLAAGLNSITFLYPPPLFWLTAGVIGLLYRPTRLKWSLLLILAIIAVMIFYPLLGIGSVFMMRVRFDPLIILFGITGLKEIILQLNRRFPGGLFARFFTDQA